MTQQFESAVINEDKKDIKGGGSLFYNSSNVDLIASHVEEYNFKKSEEGTGMKKSS